MDTNSKNTECWVVVTSGSNKYIGQVYFTDEEDNKPEEIKEAVISGIIEKGWLCFDEVFEFLTPVGMTQQGQVQRQAVVLPLEYTLEKTQFYARVDTILFFFDMTEQDRKKYNDFVENGRKAALSARAGAVGLVEARQMPKGGGRFA